MKKKMLALCLVAILGVSAMIGASLAYFVSNDEQTATFTVGDVEIELVQSQLDRTNAGLGDVDLTEIPKEGVVDEELAAETGLGLNTTYFMNEQVKNYLVEDLSEDSNVLLATDVVAGEYISLSPYVENTGAVDVYTRIVIQGSEDLMDLITIYQNGTGKSIEAITYETIRDTSDDGVSYVQVVITYQDVVEAGNMTFFNAVRGFCVNPSVEEEDFEGVDTELLVYAEAIQAEGFDSAKDAFAAYDAQ